MLVVLGVYLVNRRPRDSRTETEPKSSVRAVVPGVRDGT